MFGVAQAGAENVIFGVNDDAGKYEEGTGPFWSTLRGVGMTQNVMTVRWDETDPDAIPDESFLRSSLEAAAANGVDVVFDVYPLHSHVLGRDPAAAARFAWWTASLAHAFPQVRRFVVMNECNQPLFLNPQFASRSTRAANVSAAICGTALALAYDALKAVDPGIFVWGLGLSPRGNDNPGASSNVSTSPIKFIEHLGRWYRSTGRTAPLMDGLDVHPYPIPQSIPFASGYAAPNNFTVANLARVYQAFYDAFRGTPQRTIGPGGLKVQINEVGVQTVTRGRAGYIGFEPAGAGVDRATGTEAYQAAWYVKLVRYVQCDPNIASVNLFHLLDEADLGLWQSGLYYRDYEPKSSAAAVRAEMERVDGRCLGKRIAWKPAQKRALRPKPDGRPKAKHRG
jgi:hypothetical protein